MSDNIIPISRSAEFPKRPAGAYERDGYVYAVEFSDGTVKVGKAKSLHSRLSNHRHDAEKFALSIKRWWGSPLHRGYENSEKRLIAHATETGEVQGGREYFVGVDFDRLVAAALEVEMDPTPEHQAAAEVQKGRESVREFFGPIVERSHSTVSVDSWHAAVAIDAFFNPTQDLPAMTGDLPAETINQFEGLAEDIARRDGISTEEVMDWSGYEWLCHLLDTSVEIAKINMRLRITDEGRDDLYESWMTRGESA